MKKEDENFLSHDNNTILELFNFVTSFIKQILL